MAGLFDSLKNAAERLSTGQKIRLLLAAAATMGVVYGISEYATRVRYAVLFTGMAREDAAPILTALKEKRVPYRLGEAGATIEVPVERVDEMRMELAGEGLPRGGGIGFEIFDKPSFGLSDFVQNVNYRRALERELGRTIQSIDAVESARVHLALPHESVFAGERKDPSASVVLRLKGNRVPSAGNVRAITHLVASGVEGLDPSRVSVVDSNGRMLSEGSPDGDDVSEASGEAERTLEGHLESTLVSILEPLVGVGKARARARVELNMTRVQRVQETYDPDGAVVRSEQKSKSKSAAGGAGGVPGTTSNLPGQSPVSAAGAAGGEDSQSSTTNFEINKTVATITEPVGGLKRQSVAVVVDNAAGAPGPDGKPEKGTAPRSEEEMRKITELVRAAAGIDEARGDILIVQNIPFGESAPPVAPEPEDRWLLWIQIARYAALPIAVLLLVLLVIRPGIAALRGLQGAGAGGAAGGPPTVGEMQAKLARGMAAGDGATAGLRRKLIEAAGQEPQAAAIVLRGWLGDRHS
ncbi:MAG TPA: flagellar basal-body MS-ring/collar protein FliF [Candidatus Polarisedimenticolia bacterium]|nr:flagellar basal-body MS-ring/collar protein FliF [Candidatus Polarisedimenticolia bacterium]